MRAHYDFDRMKGEKNPYVRQLHQLTSTAGHTGTEWAYSLYMNFEFDQRKSLMNEEKHGIDFIEAQRLWDDANLLVIPARTEDEPRSVAIGMIDERHWSAVITYRGDRIRIISVRRSRKEEKELYES